jgi:Helix-turn-helix domain
VSECQRGSRRDRVFKREKGRRPRMAAALSQEPPQPSAGGCHRFAIRPRAKSHRRKFARSEPAPGPSILPLGARRNPVPTRPHRDERGTMQTADTENGRAEQARRGSPFLNTDQAARYLGLALRTLEKMRSQGRGPRFRRHGRYIRYHIAELDAWSGEQSVGFSRRA